MLYIGKYLLIWTELTCTCPLVFMQYVANPAAAIVAPHVVVTVMTTEGVSIQWLFAFINI